MLLFCRLLEYVFFHPKSTPKKGIDNYGKEKYTLTIKRFDNQNI
jgi:hypothetical protein